MRFPKKSLDMNEAQKYQMNEELAELAIDPDVLAKELEAELIGDPLDEIDLDGFESKDSDASRECELGLNWLKQGQEERLQGLRIFCEYRDPRALPLLVPLLAEPCPVIRMSAVYALGRNPCPRAVEILLTLLKTDSNAYVRKATAWSLGNYPDAPVIEPLINALKNDVSAVRLWASGSLAEAGSLSTESAELAAKQLLISLQVDNEPVVRSNCIWSLGRLYEKLSELLKLKSEEAFVNILISDFEPSVKYEARIALEQLESLTAQTKLKRLLEEGFLV